MKKVVAIRVMICVTAVYPMRSSAAQPAINEFCPVMTLEKADPKFTTIYQGKTVTFCCDRCQSKFLANPEKYIDELPQFADSSSSTSAGEGDAGVPWWGRVHPVIVHFPLAAMPLALLGFLAWALSGREAYAKADVVPLLVATLAAVAAVITGNIAHDAMRFSENLHPIVERHQFVSTTVMILALCLSAVRIWRWNRLRGTWRLLYGLGLLVTCALLALTGYFGGSLVFGPDHLNW